MKFEIKITAFVITLFVFGSMSLSESYGEKYQVIIPEYTGAAGCDVTNDCYQPYAISVGLGQTVTWINKDTLEHTVTSGTSEDGPDGSFDSELFGPGVTFSYTFDREGIYDYFCMIHPWQTGVVLVDENYNLEPKHVGSIDLIVPIEEMDQSLSAFNILGTVQPVEKMSRVDVSITNPEGQVVLTKQVYVDSDGDFETGSISRHELGYLIEGTYTIQAKHTPVGTMASDTFVYTGEKYEITPWQGPDSTQYPPLYVEVDSGVYYSGDVIRVSGFVKDIKNNMDVGLRILDPTNEIIIVDQFIPDENGRFSGTYMSGGPLWEYGGKYTAYVAYDRQTTAVSFDYVKQDITRVDTTDDELNRLQQENMMLRQENAQLHDQIDRLEKSISDLNGIVMEQLKVIYEWVVAR